MVTKLKNIKPEIKNRIFILIMILTLAVGYLSFEEVRKNKEYISKEDSYVLNVGQEIDNDISNLINIALYYKSEEYIKDVKNITENDIDICKEEIQNNIEEDFERRMDYYMHEQSYHNMSFEEQEQLRKEEREKAEKVYELTDEEFQNYIIERKLNSFKTIKSNLDDVLNFQYSIYEDNALLLESSLNNKEILENAQYIMEIDIKKSGNIDYTNYIDGKIYNNKVDNDYLGYYYSNFNNAEIGLVKKDIKMYAYIPREIVESGEIYYTINILEERYMRINFSIAICIVACIVLVILLMIKKKVVNYKDSKIEEAIKKIEIIPNDFKALIVITMLIVWNILASTSNDYRLVRPYYSVLNIRNIITISIVMILGYVIIKSLYENYKEKSLFDNLAIPKIYIKISREFNNNSLLSRIIAMGIAYVIFILALIFLAAISYGDLAPISVIVGLVVTMALLIWLIRKIIYLNNIMVGVKDIAQGKLNYKIPEEGNGHLKELSYNINNIKEGLKVSIDNEVKSEKMKTELITNVSHDLKTPLTSIINYIDLLKREEIEPEEAKDYINILDKKSQRLKVLIEDLFEASKAASGEMKLNIEKIDIIQLLIQALGENDEKIKENNLDLRSNIPPSKIFIEGDGKRLYRVFENLIINASKYSLPNTRMYVDVIKEESTVKIIIKNISAYELNFNVKEITERFKRGDEARSSEGSGLGLAIAKSIVDLHKGKLDIEIDGDLFKAIIILKI